MLIVIDKRGLDYFRPPLYLHKRPIMDNHINAELADQIVLQFANNLKKTVKDPSYDDVRDKLHELVDFHLLIHALSSLPEADITDLK